MGLSTKVTSFQYTGGSTSNISLSGWGFQPVAIITHWVGINSSTDSTGAGTIRQGWGFATSSSEQVAAGRVSTNGGASSAGANYAVSDAVICVPTDAGAADGRIAVSSFDSGGVTFSVTDAIASSMTVMVIAIGGTDITNVKCGVESDNTVTGNKSNSSVGFMPDIILFSGVSDAQAAYPNLANSEDGISFGVAKASGAGNQYTAAVSEDDSSATMDTGSYIFDNEMLSFQNATTPTSIVARKQFVSMDATGFTFNQLELPQTAGSQWHYLAIKGGNWYVGNLLTQTDTTTTVTKTGMATSPSLIMMTSVGKAKSTQDAGTAGLMMSFGAATSTSERMAMAVQDENGTANAECSTGVEYDEIYLNISTTDTVQGLGDISAINSDGFSFIMDDADPSQAYVWYIAAGSNASSETYPAGYERQTLNTLIRM